MEYQLTDEENLLVDPFHEINEFDDLPEGDGVIVISPEHRIMSANLQSERIFKIRFPRSRAIDFTRIFADEYRQQADSAINDALRNGRSCSSLIVGSSIQYGIPALLVFSVTPLFGPGDDVIGAILTFSEQDIKTHHKEMSETGHSVGYDTLFEQLAEGVFTINTRWRITAFNKRAQDITGFTREEVLGKHCWDIFKSDLCKSNCPMRITLETGIFRMDQDVRIVVKGGHRQSILVNTSVIKNNRDLVVGAVESFRPLTLSTGKDENSTGYENYMGQIIGQSPALEKISNLLPDIAVSEASVIIEGESGTGKELIAKAIHQQSKGSDGPFVAVNCSALAETLLESELFGHSKGAFTGAVNSKVGRFELAKGGTLFLDEIGEIKPEIQIKLLRVIEERVFERVGGIRPIPMDARIIAATNKTLATEVKEGRFREDLYYRLRTVPLFLPPLRERQSDIPLLVNHFISKFNRKYGKQVRGVDPKVLKIFQRYKWPGNVRELERSLEHAFVFVKGPIITTTHLPELKNEATAEKIHDPGRINHIGVMEDEMTAIKDILKKTSGRREEAAQILGISRTSLWRKMKNYGLL